MVKFFEDLSQVLKNEEEKLLQKLKVIEELKKLREEMLKRNLLKQIKINNDVYSLVGIDGTAKKEKNVLGIVEYKALAVAYFVSNSYIIPFYGELTENILPTFIWEESLDESDPLLSGILSGLEIGLLGDTAGLFNYAMLDGSLFSALLALRKGFFACKRIKGQVEKKISELIESAIEKFLKGSRHGKIIACPKRAKGGELVEYLRSKLGPRQELNYGDYIIVYGAFEPGDYIEVPNPLEIKKEEFNTFIQGLLKAGLPISQELIDYLKTFRLFYMKGLGGGVHRFEVFGGYALPAEIVGVQSIAKGNNMQIIVNAENIAKNLMTFYFPQISLIENYRG